MRNGNKEVQLAAIICLIRYLQLNYISKNNEKIIKTLVKDFKESESYFLRIVYIEFVHRCSFYFSRNFFKIHNLLAVLDLLTDKVKNVKLKLLSYIVKIRIMINDDDETMNPIIEKLDKTLK
jgi:hypothetical protein